MGLIEMDLTWDFKPSVIIGCAALLVIYAAAVKPRGSARTAAWMAGVAILFLALVSPLDTLADEYLFSAHMLKHMLLLLVVPMLLLRGLTPVAVANCLRVPAVARIERLLNRAPLAWSAGMSAMLLWHIPRFFDAAQKSEPLHIVEHLSLLVAGCIFWWPIFSPQRQLRIPPVPNGFVYLVAACFTCTLMGILITFAPPGIFTAYADAPQIWNLTRAEDQQLGGVLMWVGGCAIYVSAAMAQFARWYGEEPRLAAPQGVVNG